MVTVSKQHVIIGSILGDGSISATGSGKNFRFEVRHSAKQKEYLQWKYKILKSIVPTPPDYYERTNSWRFRTISLPEFKELRKLFYQGRRKIVPDKLEYIFDHPSILAVWYMDDGNLRREYGKIYGCMLNSQSFSYLENEKLSAFLHQHYGLRSTLQRNHGKYRLYFGADSWQKLCTIVTPYAPLAMRYKLS